MNRLTTWVGNTVARAGSRLRNCLGNLAARGGLRNMRRNRRIARQLNRFGKKETLRQTLRPGNSNLA